MVVISWSFAIRGVAIAPTAYLAMLTILPEGGVLPSSLYLMSSLGLNQQIQGGGPCQDKIPAKINNQPRPMPRKVDKKAAIHASKRQRGKMPTMVRYKKHSTGRVRPGRGRVPSPDEERRRRRGVIPLADTPSEAIGFTSVAGVSTQTASASASASRTAGDALELSTASTSAERR